MQSDSGIVDSPGNDTTGQWTGPELQPNARAVQRVIIRFFMYCIRSMAKVVENDLVLALVYHAMWTANVKHITESAANIEYGRLDQTPPDALRRPVTVMALANSLRMPHETVRRHVHILIRKGRCQRVGNKGFIVPAHLFERPDHKQAMVDGLPALLGMLDDLKQSAFDFEPYRRVLPNTVPLPADGSAPANIRAMVRAVIEAQMRGIDMMGFLHGDDFVAGLVFTWIATANVEHVTVSPENLKFGGPPQILPDEMRRPVTVRAIALALNLPYETARRAANKLVQEGKTIRIGNKGFIIPGAIHAKPDVFDNVRRTYISAARMVRDLHRAGFDFRPYCAAHSRLV